MDKLQAEGEQRELELKTKLFDLSKSSKLETYRDNLTDMLSMQTDTVYNTPDGNEDDPEIIRSEFLFYNTDRTEQWSPYVYQAINNVQDECTMDFETICDPEGIVALGDTDMNMDEDNFFSGISSLLNAFSSAPVVRITELNKNGRKLTKNVETMKPMSGSGASFIDNFRLKYRPELLRNAPVMNKSNKQVVNNVQTVATHKVANIPGMSMKKPIKQVVSNVKAGVNKSARRRLKEDEQYSRFGMKKTLKQSETRTPEPTKKGLNAVVPRPISAHQRNNKILTNVQEVVESKDTLKSSKSVKNGAGSKRKLFDDVGQGSSLNMLSLFTNFQPFLSMASGGMAQNVLNLPYTGIEEIEFEEGNEEDDDNDDEADDDYYYDDDVDQTSDSETDGDKEPFRWISIGGRNNHGDPHHRPCPPGGHGRGPPPPPPPGAVGHEDSYFMGALGFGADGDQCLYDNYKILSPSCQDSIEDFYMLRESYFDQNQNIENSARHGHGGFAWLLLALFLVVGCMRRRVWNKKTKNVREFFDKIEANPSLKQNIERETQMTLPELPEAKGVCSCDMQNQSATTVLFKICKYITMFILVVFISFFISVTSLEITSAIIGNFDAQAASSDAPPTSPLFALFVLIFVCSVELGVFFLCVRGIKACMASYQQEYQDRSPSSQPSAPPSSPLDSGGGGGNQSSGIFQSSRMQQWRNYAASQFRRTTSSSASSPVYSPLLDNSAHAGIIQTHQPQAAEMVVIAPAYNGQQVQYAQVAQQAQPVGQQVNFV